jgi:c-di-GMP-related signal transduction protein
MDAFVARQPIFDKFQKVIAYELLFRKSSNNFYEALNADVATMNVISDGFLLIGMESLTCGKKAFINFTDTLLKSEIVSTLPKDIIVVEILEDVKVDNELVVACKKLKELGYIIALDDFVFDYKFSPLIELADIIKVDFRLTLGNERKEVVERIGNTNIKFLAEKVETIEEFNEAVSYGYSYFQGFFFSKPVILYAKDVPIGRNNHIMLLSELAKPEVDFVEIANIIKRDVSLSFKLLRFINSACFSIRTKVDSIKHALVLLGKDDVSKWIYLIALKDMGKGKPDELMRISVVRGKFGELIAAKINMNSRSADVFFMGILSLIDAITNLTMENVLAQMPIAEDIKEALLGKNNIFREVYELIISYESGDWEKFSIQAKELNLDEKLVPDIYLQSIEWVNEFLQI